MVQQSSRECDGGNLRIDAQCSFQCEEASVIEWEQLLPIIVEADRWRAVSHLQVHAALRIQDFHKHIKIWLAVDCSLI